MTVSGTLDPDAADDYLPVGSYNGQPAWKAATKNWWVWYVPDYTTYVLTTVLAGGLEASDPFWFCQNTETAPIGTYIPNSPATGTATTALT